MKEKVRKEDRVSGMFYRREKSERWNVDDQVKYEPDQKKRREDDPFSYPRTVEPFHFEQIEKAEK